MAFAALCSCGTAATLALPDSTEADAGPTEDGGKETLAKLVTIPLGTVLPGEPISFDVPPNALGFNIVAVADGWSSVDDSQYKDVVVGVKEIVSPQGTVILKNHVSVPGHPDTTEGWSGVGAASVPQSGTALSLGTLGGTWKVTFSSLSAVQATVRVQATSDGAFHGGLLDVHIHITKGLTIEDPTPKHVVTAADAPRDAAIQARLESFFSKLESVFGIGRGEVTYHDVDEALLDIPGWLERQRLYAKSNAVGEGQALHVMLTQTLADRDGTVGIGGQAAGVPGALGVSGNRSGIALAMTGSGSAKQSGLVLLHEMGHLVGLSHTTDLTKESDPLSDTAVCTGIAPTLTALKRCPDIDNLMFPVGGIAKYDDVVVSPSQKTIVQASPLFRAFDR